MATPRILFFIAGGIPTEAELEEARAIGSPVAFRNVQFVKSDSSVESCDGVAGAIPERYKDFTSANTAATSFAESAKKITSVVGDVEAPKKSATKPTATWSAN